MDHATQVTEIRRLLRHIDERSTTMADAVFRNPVVEYVSDAQLAREREVLFQRLPLVLGLTGDVPDPGSYMTDEYSGTPILVVRSEQGELNAFLNVCRHRGAPLAQLERGTCRKILQCPYHGWSYDHHGKLVAISSRYGFKEVNRDDYALRALPVIERHGLVWVWLDADATGDRDAALDDHLAGLGPELDAYDIGAYHHYETRTIRRRMNWKLVIDTFLESYHLPFLHPDSINPMFYTNIGAVDPYGRNLRFIIPRRSIDELRDQPESTWNLLPHSTIQYQLFPNTMFVVQKDHFEVWRVYPYGDRVDEAHMTISLYTPEPAVTDKAKRHWNANLELVLRVVEQEDFPLGERMQRGFRTRAQACTTFGRNEPALAHYHRSIREALDL